MSLPIVYIQIVEEGRIIELRLESFDLADDLAKTIKALPAVTRVLNEWRWLPEPKAEAAQVVPVGEQLIELTSADYVCQVVGCKEIGDLCDTCNLFLCAEHMALRFHNFDTKTKPEEPPL